MTSALGGEMPRVKMVRVNRTEFREKQKEFLNKAKGTTVVSITGDSESEKVVLDRQYYDEILRRLKASIETLHVAMDKKLMSQIMAAANTLSEDVRSDKLLSMEEVFSED